MANEVILIKTLQVRTAVSPVLGTNYLGLLIVNLATNHLDLRVNLGTNYLKSEIVWGQLGSRVKLGTNYLEAELIWGQFTWI